MYGKHLSIDSRKLISEKISGKNNPMYGKSAMLGKHHTAQTKEKLKMIMNSPKVHKKLSDASKGKNNPMYGVRLPEHILEKKRKKTLCIETNIIYGSLSEASEKTNINICCIGDCCRGNQKTAGGFHWKYI